MNALDDFCYQHPEPIKATLLALREIIMKQDTCITSCLKYNMPFFYYKGKMFCYLWYHKKYKQPYIGFVEGKRLNDPFLLQEKRSRMKIMLLNPTQDLPLHTLQYILQKALNFYKTGEIKTKE
ncbi:MAG: DUF1801 domain-containing protein [Sphingobacteriales bacterium]|nr:MAG: DUF1801 domain-containing protein [Sphingobacteriales bacterium]TAF80872.1 MAG: DUF1801 domain-containing protein [Sphingobacteriales bacterium]